MRHITNSELAGYMARLSGDREQNRIAEHLSRCGRCRARHDAIAAAMAPRYRSLRANDAVKARVMRSRNSIASEEIPHPTGGVLSMIALHPRAALAASIAAAAAIVAAVSLLIRTPADETRPHLLAARADAGVTVNAVPAGDRPVIFEKSRIVLPEHTVMRLEYGPAFSITLIGPADFFIDRLKSSGTDRPADLGCTLSQGILISAHGGAGKALVYAYDTPGARIEPSGTEFLLQASGDATLVLVNSGAVRVKHRRSGEATAVPAGSRCAVSEKTEISKAAPEDLSMFGNIEKIRAGDFSQRLLKPVFRAKELTHTPPLDQGRAPAGIGQGAGHDDSGKVNNGRRKPRQPATIINPARPDLRERDGIKKTIIRDTKRTLRQKRRASR